MLNGTRRACLARLLGCALLLAPQAVHAQSTGDPFAACATAIAAAPQRYESARCYFDVAAQTGGWDMAARRLELLVRASPDQLWLQLVQAYVEGNQGHARAVALYRAVAQRFAAAANDRGELLARSSLSLILSARGHAGAAAREVRRVAALGARSADPELRIRALVVEARLLVDTGHELEHARRNLQRAEAALSPKQSYWMRRQVLSDLGNIDVWLGYYGDALRHYSALAVAAAAAGDLEGVALAKLSIANVRAEAAGETAEDEHSALLAAAQSALAAARAARSEHLELLAERLLVELLFIVDPATARAHLERCVRLARRAGEPGPASECMWFAARLLARRDPRAAQARIREAASLVTRSADQPRLVYAFRHRMRIAWESASFDRALADADAGLLAIESLRALQPGELGRTAVLSVWARDYYWLSGRLLQRALHTGEPEPAGAGRAALVSAPPVLQASALVARAFAVTERMRARALLESLARQHAPSAADRAARGAVLQAIVDHNRQLLTNADAQREGPLLRGLEELERRAAELDERALAAVAPAAAAHALHSREQRRTGVPLSAPTSLAEVQRALVRDEALLSYQLSNASDVAGDYAGEAWLLVITRDDVRVLRIPERRALIAKVRLYLGLLDTGGAALSAAAAVLYRDLLDDALHALPTRVHKLILVPDGPLHALPFAALRAHAAQDGVGARYVLSVVPSATLWLHWRQRPPGVFAAPVFAFADPASAAVLPSQLRAAAAARFAPLPQAAAEARAIIERTGNGSLMAAGRAAAEARLKTLPPAGFAVLHFATHAHIDALHPERSAIVLGAGAADDGLLQPREIDALNLYGQLIVLSACDSANGTLVRGEGVLGLARSFFAAGASAVVGSLWRVRDEHARAFFVPFYAALNRGEDVGIALQSAQQQLRAAGYPVRAWAGFVLLGDARLRPIARSATTTEHGSERELVAGFALLVLLLAAMLWRRRAARRGVAAAARSGSGLA